MNPLQGPPPIATRGAVRTCLKRRAPHPITNASRVGDSIRVELTEEQIEHLPPVSIG